MPAEITPQFVMQYERRMRAITEVEYARRLAAENTWWNKILRTIDIEGKSERITWLLSTAFIEPVGPSGAGAITFEDMVTQTAEYPVLRHGKGIKVHRDQIEDLNGTGLDILAEWSAQIGNEIAYYPQRLAAQIILNGAATDGTANAYDGNPFFSDNTNPHPNNPYNNPGAGTYANWLHGGAGSIPGPAGSITPYPGALPIDESVSVDTALENLGKAIAYIASLKMPNGVDPRFLVPKFVLVPPRLGPRIRELTQAKLIAQMAKGAGGGSADVESLIRGWGLGQPVLAQELAASSAYSFQAAVANPTTGALTMQTPAQAKGNDTTYYIICQEMQTTQLGGLLLVMRKPFKVTYYSGDMAGSGLDAILDRANEFEYHVQGRMSAQYGHPYTIFRVDAS